MYSNFEDNADNIDNHTAGNIDKHEGSHPDQVIDIEAEGNNVEVNLGVANFEPGSDYNYITSTRYPGCGTHTGSHCVQDGILLCLYHLTGGFLTFGASLISFIAIVFVMFILSPCQYKSIVTKAWVMMYCELNPIHYKYRYIIEDQKKQNNFLKIYLSIWWLILSIFRGVLHLFVAIALFFSIIFYPIGIIHWNLAQVSLFAFNFEIVNDADIQKRESV